MEDTEGAKPPEEDPPPEETPPEESAAPLITDWEPSPEELVAMFEKLDKDGYLPLLWECPGRKAPNEEEEFYSEEEAEEEEQTDRSTDFDFDDEPADPKLTPRRSGSGGLKGSARKKTTSLSSVLSSMKRHKQVDVMEKAKGLRKYNQKLQR